MCDITYRCYGCGWCGDGDGYVWCDGFICFADRSELVCVLGVLDVLRVICMVDGGCI